MRIAFFSPLSPKPSGISDYSEALLPHLAERMEEIDVFIEDYEPTPRFPQANLRIRPWQQFEPDYHAGAYDAVLYQMGNNPFHVYIYDLALRIPGVVVLHEFNLHYLVAQATIVRQDWDGYFREVEHNASRAALERARRAQVGGEQPDYDRVPMNRRLIESSQAAIVHSEYMVRLLRQAGFSIPVRKIPHGVEIPAVDVAPVRLRLAELTGLSCNDSTPVFGIFGFLKPYKRIHEALRALARLRAEHPNVKMVLVGEEHPHYPLRPLIAELHLEDAVSVLGYVPLETFITCLAATDVCINLRRPTAGETSGSFLRALALGKPTLVSEIGAFLELPEEAAIKIPVDDREEDWLYETMRVLLMQPDLARAVGKRGRAFVEQECLWPKVAGEYAQFIEECAGKKPREATSETKPAGAVPPEKRAARATPSSAELEEYIVGFSHGSRLMEEYVLTHLKRLVRTVEITPPGGDEDRILELGCYLQLTPALRKYLGYGEVRGAYYGTLGQTDRRSTTSITGEVFSCQIDLFDAEKDRFPYTDGYFRTVLCCELIEHLTTDPMHLMAEISRILSPGGFLVLTTPNISSLRSVHAVLHGYHPELFSSYIRASVDGTVDPRHSREYTPREIALLVEAAGFQVVRLETADYAHTDPQWEPTRNLLQTNDMPTDLRGEMIACVGRKIGSVRDRWPKELYYSP